MPNSEIAVVVVNIMGRELKIRSPKDKTSELQQAAVYLNHKMQEVQKGDASIVMDRVAITAALNIIHELILEKQHLQLNTQNLQELNQSCLRLKHKLTAALATPT